MTALWSVFLQGIYLRMGKMHVHKTFPQIREDLQFADLAAKKQSRGGKQGLLEAYIPEMPAAWESSTEQMLVTHISAPKRRDT